MDRRELLKGTIAVVVAKLAPVPALPAYNPMDVFWGQTIEGPCNYGDPIERDYKRFSRYSNAS